MARVIHNESISGVIARKHYVATEAEVEALAHAQYSAAATVSEGQATYLRVLVAASQARLGKGKPGRRPVVSVTSQGEVVEAVHAVFYNAVLRGITTDDITHDGNVDAAEQRRRTLERNRRSAFARSAVSTLRAFVQGGGDIRTLTVETVTKAELRAAVAPPEPTDKVARQIQRSQGALIRALQRQARDDPDAAAASAEAALAAIEAMFAEPAEQQAAPQTEQRRPEAFTESTLIGGRRTRVGTPVILHRPAAGAP